MKKTALVLLMVALALGGVALQMGGQAEAGPEFSRWVDRTGRIRLPSGFREQWSHLGSWAVRGDDEELSFHDVYTEPESAAYFREHQAFPDGATLVKEVRSSKAGTMTTGHASWADRPQIWFVMIKDDKSRFPTNPIWGEGWGWALFDAKEPGTLITRSYEQECRSCHVPARQTDWVYVQGYPTLGWVGAGEKDEPKPGLDGVPEGSIVKIENLSFSPREINVRRGETITWLNRDDFVHTATASEGVFDTGNLAPGETASVTFGEAGTFYYYCTPHPFMKATVVVE